LSAGRLLVVNADDFGFTSDVNAGIVEAHRKGILTATTLMANGAAFDDAVRLARETPTLDIGCHLVLVGGRSLIGDRGALPATVTGLLQALGRRRIRVQEELEAQVERILAAGIVPTHLDTHKHTHLAPPVLREVAKVAEKYGIRWVRRPFDFPLTAVPVPLGKRLASRALGGLRGYFHRVLARHGCRSTDHFAGFQITGRFRTEELVRLIGALPPGSTELMVHPGFCGEQLRGASTRLKESREHELAALVSPEARDALARHGVRLTGYRGLG
jgi:chitin disaccharide deacetylase